MDEGLLTQLATAVGRQSVEMLDNCGIRMLTRHAYRRYLATLRRPYGRRYPHRKKLYWPQRQEAMMHEILRQL